MVLLGSGGALVLAACGSSNDDSGDGGQSGGKGGTSVGVGGASGGTAGKQTGSGGGGGTGAKGGSSSGGKGGGGITDSGGAFAAGAGGEAGAAATSDLKFPITLAPIGAPLTTTAHVSLYFTASDADGEPVPKLVPSMNYTPPASAEFIAKEDGTALDKFESAFKVTNPKGALVIPTVLLLDLSRSVVQAGALDDLKKAAGRIIDNLDPAQRLAIVTFASNTTTRQTFSTDKTALHATIDAITMADGVSTNLYGALIDGYKLWDDGFRVYDASATAPQLVAGLLIAVSDGSDTAAVSTLNDVKQARGNKRTIFIRIGEDVDPSVPEEVANAGVITAKGGFGDLDTAVDAATERITKLNGAIYAAEYCSPKRAGTHDLVFTLKGNEPYVTDGSSPTPTCAPNTNSTSTCDSGLLCQSACCPSETPYYCASSNKCYYTAASAAQNCASACIACGAASESTTTPTPESGPAISVEFAASAFSDAQCNDLFTTTPPDGTGGKSGTGGMGGTGGVGGMGGTGGTGMNDQQLATACALFEQAAYQKCGGSVFAAAVITNSNYVTVPLDDSCSSQPCATEHATLLDCLRGALDYGVCNGADIFYDGDCSTQATAALDCNAVN